MWRTLGVGDIKDGELGDERVLLEQQRQRLANATSTTEHGDLVRLLQEKNQSKENRRKKNGQTKTSKFAPSYSWQSPRNRKKRKNGQVR